MKKLVFAIGIIALTGPVWSYANTMAAVTAKVIGAGTYDDGSVYLFFDRQISSCDAAQNRIDVPHTSAAAKNVLSIGMTALTSGANVTVHPGACDANSSAFDERGDSYIYLSK